ncbi:MAG: LmeA family phospholipid-binding protein, partial [Acidobacteriota bacterium]|nr:LmeA family phospholipid-binding protein [Acidobacteriota bacterium]
MSRRAVRVLLVLVLVVVVVLVGLDVGARTVAQDDVASRAKSATDAESASATIGGFPFLSHLLGGGDVPDVRVRLTEVSAGPLRAHEIDVDLRGVHVDRGALFSHRQVRVQAIDSATATVTVTAADLSAAAGLPVTIPGQGEILVEAAGRSIPASVVVEPGDLLVLTVAGRAVVRADLATSPLVPDCAMALQFAVGSLRVS